MDVSRKYFSLAMATLMLLMSIGMTVHKMVCLVSGAVTLSFLENEDCCPAEEKNDNAVTTQCCDYSTDYFKLDIQTLVSSFDFKFDIVQHFFLFTDFVFPEITQNQISQRGHSPPLPSGKSILVFVSVFRI